MILTIRGNPRFDLLADELGGTVEALRVVIVDVVLYRTLLQLQTAVQREIRVPFELIIDDFSGVHVVRERVTDSGGSDVDSFVKVDNLSDFFTHDGFFSFAFMHEQLHSKYLAGQL